MQQVHRIAHSSLIYTTGVRAHVICSPCRYGAPPAPAVDPYLAGLFRSVDTDNSGEISADELQAAVCMVMCARSCFFCESSLHRQTTKGMR